MLKKKALLLIASSFVTLFVYSQTAERKHFNGKTWREHVKALASDNE